MIFPTFRLPGSPPDSRFPIESPYQAPVFPRSFDSPTLPSEDSSQTPVFPRYSTNLGCHLIPLSTGFLHNLGCRLSWFPTGLPSGIPRPPELFMLVPLSTGFLVPSPGLPSFNCLHPDCNNLGCRLGWFLSLGRHLWLPFILTVIPSLLFPNCLMPQLNTNFPSH